MDTKRLDATVANDISVLIKQEDKNSELLPEVKLDNNLKAPIKKGDVVGQVSYVIEDITYTENLIANSDVKKSKSFIRIVEIFFILFLCWLYLKFKSIKKKKQRLKNRYR